MVDMDKMRVSGPCDSNTSLADFVVQVHILLAPAMDTGVKATCSHNICLEGCHNPKAIDMPKATIAIAKLFKENRKPSR